MPKFHRTIWLAALVTLAACATVAKLLPDSDFTSVEAVLRQSESVGAQLDREERELAEIEGRAPASRMTPSFQQPLRQFVSSSGFGKRGSGRHDGVDLRATYGTPIYASEKGIVVFASNHIDGYGDTVILRHVGGYATLYAHASLLRVMVGDRVKKGDCIAYSGDSGNASGPHLHFEVREGRKAVNPLLFINRKSRKLHHS